MHKSADGFQLLFLVFAFVAIIILGVGMRDARQRLTALEQALAGASESATAEAPKAVTTEPAAVEGELVQGPNWNTSAESAAAATPLAVIPGPGWRLKRCEINGQELVMVWIGDNRQDRMLSVARLAYRGGQISERVRRLCEGPKQETEGDER